MQLKLLTVPAAIAVLSTAALAGCSGKSAPTTSTPRHRSRVSASTVMLSHLLGA